MRFHRHQVGREQRWHSVRVRHDSPWDWCAHHEEIEDYIARRRRAKSSAYQSKQLTLQTAH